MSKISSYVNGTPCWVDLGTPDVPAAVAFYKGLFGWEIEIGPADFVENIQRVVYHLDYPVAGPGSFPQYMVSGLAARQRKVLLGGQGGDEIFGGYVRYLTPATSWSHTSRSSRT